MPDRGNLVLIGMPGAGKSTAGLLAAKRLAMPFVDVDVALQAREGRRLDALLTIHGHAAFCALESRFVLEQHWERSVIATGGSLVYSHAAMDTLVASGMVVYLEATPALLATRLGDLDTRGVVRRPDQSLEALYRERRPLYEAYAHVTIPCAGKSTEMLAAEIAAAYEAGEMTR